jgi:hypothetical protein
VLQQQLEESRLDELRRQQAERAEREEQEAQASGAEQAFEGGGTSAADSPARRAPASRTTPRRRYGVIEVRRLWDFDDQLKLQQEVRYV